MSQTPARAKWLWQYSLRGLLLAMVFIGLGLVAFRWPWVEREVFTDPLGYSEVQIRTFRRDWNGGRLRHGLTKFGPLEEFYVDDGKIWEARYTAEGQLKSKLHYSNGLLHGPFFDLAGGLEGQYDHGQRTGRWLVTTTFEQEKVVSEQWYEAGQPHGDWSWKSGDRRLQSATFEHGRLLTWNGQPLAAELDRVLAYKQVDADTRAALASPVEQVDFDNWSCHGGAAFEWPMRNGSHRLLLQVPMCSDSCQQGTMAREWQDPQQPVCAAFLERALIASRTLDYRFGVICFVPIASSELTWQDRSGVSQIQFERGSREEAAWLEPVRPSAGLPSDVRGHLEQLFAGTPIRVDVVADRLPPPRPSGAPGNREPLVRRSRKDVLGMFLASRGWSCQQRGSKLEIVPAGKS